MVRGSFYEIRIVFPLDEDVFNFERNERFERNYSPQKKYKISIGKEIISNFILSSQIGSDITPLMYEISGKEVGYFNFIF